MSLRRDEGQGRVSLPLVLGCLWVVASALVAFLPMRRQYAPGLALLLAAPVLIVLLGLYHGPWMALVALAGFLSMFRNPVIYLARKALGLPVQPLPADMEPDMEPDTGTGKDTGKDTGTSKRKDRAR